MNYLLMHLLALHVSTKNWVLEGDYLGWNLKLSINNLPCFCIMVLSI